MRFKKSPQLPGAGRTWAGHHNGSHTPTSTGAILLSKMARQPKHFGRHCKLASSSISNSLKYFSQQKFSLLGEKLKYLNFQRFPNSKKN